MGEQAHELGMVGLGVMGRNLLLNMAEHGYTVAGHDLDPEKVRALRAEAGAKPIRATADLREFVSVLRAPRVVMLLVPAGPPVDAVLQGLLPLLRRGDLVIDGGNSHFSITDLRAKKLAETGILYLGVGVSGGEHGARHGPSLMPGGPREAYERVRPVFEAVAAKVDGAPCVAYLGPGSAGHYVKMVHNGIEYGLMRLIAECYDLMRRGLGLSDDEMAAVFGAWDRGELNGYLLEITARIFRQVDERTGTRLIDVILDVAKQKGTGMWASQDAMDLQVPTPVIDVAVAMRNMSLLKAERERAERSLNGPPYALHARRDEFLAQLRRAQYAAMLITYAQGFVQLRAASHIHGYGLNLEDVARIWRGGCIIRAGLLEGIRTAFHSQPELPNLLLDPALGAAVRERQDDLRAVVCAAAQAGLPVLALMMALGYLDGYRSAWHPANLTQAQRDYFGAHTYERVDVKGVFHTHWGEGSENEEKGVEGEKDVKGEKG